MVAHSRLSADRLRTLAAWCVLLFFYLAALGHVGLVDPDEGRYTLIPLEMHPAL